MKGLYGFHLTHYTLSHTHTYKLMVYILYIKLKVCTGLNCVSKKVNSGRYDQIILGISPLRTSLRVCEM